MCSWNKRKLNNDSKVSSSKKQRESSNTRLIDYEAAALPTLQVLLFFVKYLISYYNTNVVICIYNYLLVKSCNYLKQIYPDAFCGQLERE